MEKIPETFKRARYAMEPFPGEVIYYTDAKGIPQKKFIWNFEHANLSEYKTLGITVGLDLSDCASSGVDGIENFADRIVGFTLHRFYHEPKPTGTNISDYVVMEFYEER